MCKSQFVIGAAGSGSGKTTLALGLMKALADRGLDVQPFKCGPDYIDPKYHALAAGRDSINLDLFMASASHVKNLYARYSHHADVCLTEGVMGLFDGYSGWKGSSYELARTLGIPIVLVLNARSSAYSVAPLLYGFSRFLPDTQIAGVIFNRVSSDTHYSMLKDAAADVGISVLGRLPETSSFHAPSRHLGLSLENIEAYMPVVEAISNEIRRHVDLDRLLEVTSRPALSYQCAETLPARKGLRIAVANDEAFNFIYRANIDRLEEIGEIVFFSPLKDSALPEADLVYLPGGYPEFYLEELSANTSMRQSVADFAERNVKILAECGGMMYLCRSIRSEKRESYSMCGVLPLDSTMEGMRMRLGYRTVVSKDDRFGIRGHEFHYSRTEGSLPSAAIQFSARGDKIPTPLYRYRNVLAGYTHLYWAETDPLQMFEYLK